MAKSIRTIKADLRRDETLGTCTRDARLLFVLLITACDDHGRFRASSALLRGELFPYDDDITRAYGHHGPNQDRRPWNVHAGNLHAVFVRSAIHPQYAKWRISATELSPSTP